jgi:hypothetical protein
MKRFKSQRHLQRFVSIHDPIASLFHVPRYDIPSSNHRRLRSSAMNLWAKIAERDWRNRSVPWFALVAAKFTMPRIVLQHLAEKALCSIEIALCSLYPSTLLRARLMATRKRSTSPGWQMSGGRTLSASSLVPVVLISTPSSRIALTGSKVIARLSSVDISAGPMSMPKKRPALRTTRTP